MTFAEMPVKAGLYDLECNPKSYKVLRERRNKNDS